MNAWTICLGAVVGLFGIFGGLVAMMRIRSARARSALRDAVRSYAEKRGARVEHDPDGRGFRVKGPRGEGHESMTALEVMCRPGEEHRWETSIGFVLRKYIPDAFDEAFAKAARERLAKLAPEIARLSDDELRSRLRAQVVSTRTSDEGLATCAVRIGESYEARVVLEGFDLQGLPRATRDRLAESDDELYERALSATLATAPAASAGEAGSHVWLCRPEAIFGSHPHLVVGAGERLAWMRVTPDDVEERLVALCNRACESGPMKGVLWAWDGTALTHRPIIAHTVLGPSTPDYTLQVPVSFHETLGVHPGNDGTFGVRRASRRA